ncbi:ATP-binding protein [Undibacterium sp. SXout20W]|uniref:ATP-binding protein n=1 Tax=Undibacterium sp. SXout20W TaxID=3413051 RepID=UPI003BF30DC6
MRLTIAKKIAVTITTIVILCIGTMAWISSQNLKRGFISYLSELEQQDLRKLSQLLAEDYRRDGNFDHLSRDREGLHDILEQMRPHPPRNVIEQRPISPTAETSAAPDVPLPERSLDQPPPDPMGFAQRLALIDEHGTAIIGPRDAATAPDGSRQSIVVDKRVVGTLRLAPLRNISNANGLDFVRIQIQQTIWLALGLIIIALILSIYLARHLLRPLKSLHKVSKRIAKGQFQARAEVLNQDELGELAKDINSMARSLQQNETQRRQMLADISHELRTPLTVILGEVEAIIDGVRTSSPAAMASLHAEILHLNKLVDDVRQLTLADAGDLRYEFARIDIVALVASITQRYTLRLQKAQLSIQIDFPAEPTFIRGDTSRMTQVISNLLENSIRYTDSPGTLRCSISSSRNFVEICIEDSAPGVPLNAHSLLFDRLYRVDMARSRAHGGSGLGLSICKALLTAQDGEIDAMPSVLGGLKMVIRLPLIL